MLEGGRLHVRCDEPDDAAGAFAHASALFESVGDLAGQTRAEAGRSRAAELRSRFDDAVRFAERALALARRCGSALLQVHSLNAAALALEAAGRFDDALALLAEASALARAAGDLSFEGVLDGNRGCVLLRLGRLDEAEQHLRRSAALNGTHGARRREADSLVHLAIVLHERGDLARARDLYRQAFAIFRECGERKLSAELLPFRAACAAELGLLAEARADLAVARRELERLADPESLAVADTLESIGATDTGIAAARLGRAEALLRDPAAGRVANLIVALRIVRRVLAGAPAEGLEVGPDASWFRAGDREPVDLSRHATLRRVLVALLEHRLRAPGEGLTQHDLFAIAWPNERAQSASAAGRVYTAVSSLRRLGLDGALVRRDQGYLLDAAVPVRSSATPRRGSVA